MQTSRPQIGDVTYNAATQSFEALVTFDTPTGRIRVAASVPGQIAQDPETMTDALRHDALERKSEPSALHARLEGADAPRRRAAYPPRRWYAALIGRDAA